MQVTQKNLMKAFPKLPAKLAPETNRFEIGDWGSVYEMSPACRAIDEENEGGAA